MVLYTKGSVLSGIGINDELVPHLKWLLAKNDLEALFPSFPIVDTLTLPLIEIGDEKQADLTRTPLFIKQESPKMLFGSSPRFDLSLLQRFVSLHVDMRVIAASNVPLKEMVTEGKMRSDFYYRINVPCIWCLSVNERSIFRCWSMIFCVIIRLLRQRVSTPSPRKS